MSKDLSPVILMVGGAGKRLMPLTENTPKSLLQVQGKPLLERMLEFLADSGYHDIHLSVNNKCHKLRNHFQDGAKWNLSISYLVEEEPMGTCGALRLLAKRPEQPILVMNGDLITNIDLDKLLKLHLEKKALATVCSYKYTATIPYGVVETADGMLASVTEKPTSQHWINAGIYVLEPAALDLIPAAGAFDMPDMLQLCAKNGGVAVYKMSEDWIDIGSLEEYHRANRDALPERKIKVQSVS